MKRLWENDPKMAGLVRRRELEALLFEQGLG
jgi:GH24 family phage-related lysozyme (muramidase)